MSDEAQSVQKLRTENKSFVMRYFMKQLHGNKFENISDSGLFLTGVWRLVLNTQY